MEKITIIGDIMVEPPFMQQVKQGENCDFLPSMLPLKHIFSDSDYVIANLETPLAGPEAGYTERIVSFNAPDSLADAVKALGIDAVSTSNNHCLDRGYEGLVRTLQVLDDRGIAHTGTYPEGFTGDRNLYFTVGDTRCALIAYANGTNCGINGHRLVGDRLACVNMFRDQLNAAPLSKPMPQSYTDTKNFIEELLGHKMMWEDGVKLKIAMHLPVAYADEIVEEEEQDLYLRRIEEDYRRARENADLVFFYPHVGGQFNTQPGAYSLRLVQKTAQMGFDAVFAAHSHTTQKAEYVDGKPCFYSLGNVTMSPGTFYSVSESLPDYGIGVHLYIENKKIEKVTISIFKMVEENGEALRVVPVDLLYQELAGQALDHLRTEVAEVFLRITGKNLPDGAFQKEYELN